MARNENRKIDWTPEDRARHKAIRERFKDRPTQEQMLASGEYVGPIPHGAHLSLVAFLMDLKKAREAAGLSLSELAERTGIDKAALSRLENGISGNPTVETLIRYATSVGKQINWQLEDLAKPVKKRAVTKAASS